MRRSVMTLSLCLSTLVLMAGKCDGDDVVTTSKDQPNAPADPNSVTEDAAAALGVEPSGEPSAASVDEAVGAPDESAGADPGTDELGADPGAGATAGKSADKAPADAAAAGGDGDIFTDPLTGDAPGTGPIDDLGDTPIEDSFLDDPSFEPEAPPVDEP